FPGGISFGTITLVDGQFQTDGGKSTIEVVNFLGGKGNDKLDVQGTLDPAPAVSTTSTFVFNSAAGTVTRAGFDCAAQRCIPGQTVTTPGVGGIWTVTSITGVPPGDHSILHLSGATPLPSGSLLKTLNAADALIDVTVTVTVTGTADNPATEINESG